MAIPSARVNDVPPALPPPRYIHELYDVVDTAWRYHNEELSFRKSKLAPMKAGPSLLGLSQLTREDDEDMNMDMDMGIDHASNNLTSTRSPSQSQLAIGTSIPSLIRRPPSFSGINQELQGKKPLAQQNHHQSTHAYDKHLLLKIGRSNSAPGHPKPHSRDNMSRLSIQTKGPSLLARSAHDLSSSSDPFIKSTTSLISAVFPSSRLSWLEHSMDPRSPSSENTSYEIDPERFSASCGRNMSSRSQTGSTYSPEDARTRSERGSHDSAIFEDVRSASDKHSFQGERPRPALQYLGTKRRALSPYSETTHEHRHESLPPRPQGRTDRQTGPPPQPYQTGLLSSTASSTHYNSYTSSNLFSTSSTVTSISSIETPASREPTRQLFTSPTSASSSSAVAILPLRKSPKLNKISLQSAVNDLCTLTSRIGDHYVCSCCPKKPKKFETEEKLRAHENEKQYTCAYCNSRFKNKNEAERHQNSLHLRKQSWSCAAISTYQAIFHPSVFSNSRKLATETCGFCGEEFTKHPPNWDDRIDHLTKVHKFGECNSTKKFYRADHFQQHLKHSHAGKSGKSINGLEKNCRREEAPSEGAIISPIASEHSQVAVQVGCRYESHTMSEKPTDS